MNFYRLSKEAEQNLEDFWVHLGERNDLAADRQTARFFDQFPLLHSDRDGSIVSQDFH